jgi:hypothetical protein
MCAVVIRPIEPVGPIELNPSLRAEIYRARKKQTVKVCGASRVYVIAGIVAVVEDWSAVIAPPVER